MSEAKKRVVWVDLLRVVAILGVITIHTVISYVAAAPADDSVSMTYRNFVLCNGIIAVPCFIMMSGMLTLRRERSPKQILLKNVLKLVLLRLACAFLCVVIAIMFAYYQDTRELITPANMWYVAWNYGQGMNYLFILGGCYVMTPVFYVICNNKTVENYYVAIALLFTTILPCIYELTGHTDLLNWTEESAMFYMPLGIAFYYPLGHFLDRISEHINKLLATVLLLGTMALNYVITYYDLFHEGENGLSVLAHSYYSGYTAVITILYSGAVLIFFKVVIGSIPFPEKIGKFFNHLGRMVMLIYIAHGPILVTFASLIEPQSFSNLALGVVCKVGFVFLFGYVIALIWSFIPGLKKLLG